MAPCSPLAPEAAGVVAGNCAPVRSSDCTSSRGACSDMGVAVMLPWDKGKSRTEEEEGEDGEMCVE